MENYLAHKGDEKVSVTGDQGEFQQQQQSSTLTDADQPKGAVESPEEGGDDASKSAPPFTEGYGTTGGEDQEKHHGFGNAV